VTFREKSGEYIKGLGIISVSQQKAELLHLSTIEMSDFQKALVLISEYTKNNSVIIDFVVKLMHYEIPDESGKPKKAMNPFFKTVLQEAGFK
jgi:hypothetical protein